MIYVVSNNNPLFSSFTNISVDKSLDLLSKLSVVGLDTETSGLDVHTDKLLTLQLGNKELQVVIDCSSIDIKEYKDFLESDRLFIAHNLKFDYKWLIKENIVLKNTYDTFITEKVLNLGLTYVRCSLKEVAKRYLNIDLDKSIRGEIIYKGITDDVIKYAAYDVVYLEEIMNHQKRIYEERGQEFAVRLENKFVPVLSYMEYCGIKLDVEKWKYKMSLDIGELINSREELDNWVINYCKSKGELPIDIWKSKKKKRLEWEGKTYYDELGYPVGIYAVQPQLTLFEEFNEEERCVLNWNSSSQLVPLFEELGFNVWTKDKKTGKPKKSVDSRLISLQKDKSDIVPIYLKYSASNKKCTSFGQNYLDAVNSNTKRLHPEFNQLISSGRMSCGKGNSDSEDSDEDKSINVQQLPNDHLTRECFIPEEGYSIIAADYSDQEGHQFANLTQDKAWIDFYNDTSGRDGHSFVAKMIFKEELKDVEEKDIKKLRPDLRQKAKAPRFTFNYRGTPKALQANTGLPLEECEKMFENYFKSFSGIKSYFDSQEKKMWNNGYIEICQFSKMRSYIPYWKELKWLNDNTNNYSHIWDYYKEGKANFLKNGTDIKLDVILQFINKLKEGHTLLDSSLYINEDIKDIVFHSLKYMFKVKSSYANKSANMPSQGSSAHMTKTALINYYKSIIDRGLLHKYKIINAVHDEILIEVPDEVAEEEALLLRKCMEDSSKFYCRSVFIKAVPEIGKHWIH